MKGTSCPHSHSLFGVLRRETLWEVWNVATSKGVLSKLWIYWKLCKPKKKASFSNHICPCAFKVNRRILAAQKKTHHHFCKRCLAPQIQFGQKRFRENASIQGAQARESNCNSFEELHPAEVHWLTEATLLLLHLLLLSHTLVMLMMNFWRDHGLSTGYQRSEYKDHDLDCLANTKHPPTS